MIQMFSVGAENAAVCAAACVHEHMSSTEQMSCCLIGRASVCPLAAGQGMQSCFTTRFPIYKETNSKLILVFFFFYAVLLTCGLGHLCMHVVIHYTSYLSVLPHFVPHKGCVTNVSVDPKQKF